MLTNPPTYGTLPISSVPAYVAAAPPMSERVLLLSPRDIDRATLVASSALTSLPVTNLQNQEPRKVWRSLSAVSQYVDITLDSPIACNAIAMSGFNMSAAGVWRLHGYASVSDMGVTAAVSSAWQSVWPGGLKHYDPDWGPEVALLRIENENPYLHWRIEFSDPSEATTFLDIGRLALGRAVQFSINCDIDGGIGFVPNDVAELNGYGQIFTDPRPYAQRTFDMPWTALAQDEVSAQAMELSRLRGQAGDVFCFLDPCGVSNFHLWSMQGLFTGRAQYTPRPLFVGGMMCWSFTFSLIQKL